MAKVMIFFTLLAVLVSITSAYNEGDECYVEDPKEYGYYRPHPIYCYRFLQCTHGRFVGRNCSPGLFWNTEVNLCDFPNNLNPRCEGQTTERSTTTTTPATTTSTTTTTTYYPTEYPTTYEATHTPSVN